VKALANPSWRQIKPKTAPRQAATETTEATEEDRKWKIEDGKTGFNRAARTE
jgi:hypothetical protein